MSIELRFLHGSPYGEEHGGIPSNDSFEYALTIPSLSWEMAVKERLLFLLPDSKLKRAEEMTPFSKRKSLILGKQTANGWN